MANHKYNWWPAWTTAALGIALGGVIGGAALLAPPPVEAVHGAIYPFEVDGNLVSNGKLDWATVDFSSNDATFISDAGAAGSGKEVSAYAGSNKDIDIITTWEYASSKVTPDKDNITNAYALNTTVDVDPTIGVENHQVIYFGADRFSNNGDAALGFWFFQSQVGPGPNGKFIGEHVARSTDGPGDVLVQVDFSPNPDATKPPTFEIQIFEWVGSGGSHGPLDELEFTGVKAGTVCIGDSGTTDHPDAACATTNPVNENAPWAYRAKDSKIADEVFPKQSFFEGGIDITELLGDVCFATYLAETRSSHSETAELKDFASGPLESCSIDLVRKQCVADDVAPYLSPRYNPDSLLFETVHTVEINNDGGGSLHDIAIQDNTIGIDMSCKIIGITGDGTGPDPAYTLPKVFTTNTQWIEVANELPSDGTINVELFCESSLNQKQNTVSVRAAGTAGGNPTITDTPYGESSDDVADCGVSLQAKLQLNKFCANEGSEESGNPAVTIYNPLYDPATDLLAVTLNASNSFKPQVCVDVVLTNISTPSQTLVVDTLLDDEGLPPIGGIAQFANLLSSFQAANNTNGTPCGGANQPACNRLAPNETVAFSRCYTPIAPDNNATNPGLAEYTDTVYADVHGVTAGTFDASDSATCGLCPSCPCDE